VRDLALVLASPTKMCVLFGLRFRKEVLNQRALEIIYVRKERAGVCTSMILNSKRLTLKNFMETSLAKIRGVFKYVSFDYSTRD